MDIGGTTRRETFATIQAGRGIAALLVVLYHADRVVANPGYWGARVAGGAFACGHAGVEFFFVLSGFIIAHVHGRDIGRPERLGRFVARRFDRIYPLYWLVLAPLTALALAGPYVASLAHVDRGAILASIVLAGPDAHGGVLTVSWTLFHELLFYVAFALLIAERRLGAVAVATWAVAIVAGPVRGIPAYVASPLNLLFAAGTLVQMAVVRGLVRRPVAWVAAGAVALITLGVEEVAWRQFAEMPRNLLYGLASAVLLAGAVATERRHPVAVPPPLMMLGAASYSLYLVHYPALSAVAVVLRRAGVQRLLPTTAGAAVLIVVVVALGIAVHVWVERPLLNSLQRLRSRAAPVTTAAPAISG